eukprot:4074979-Prymnesium_polylepis.1
MRARAVCAGKFPDRACGSAPAGGRDDVLGEGQVRALDECSLALRSVHLRRMLRMAAADASTTGRTTQVLSFKRGRRGP